MDCTTCNQTKEKHNFYIREGNVVRRKTECIACRFDTLCRIHKHRLTMKKLFEQEKEDSDKIIKQMVEDKKRPCHGCNKYKDFKEFRYWDYLCRDCRSIYLQKQYFNFKPNHTMQKREVPRAAPEAFLNYKQKYMRNKIQTDELYRLQLRLGSLIREGFENKGWKKDTKKQAMLGCSFSELINHLEQTCINNYGYSPKELRDRGYKLHIDHIIPQTTAKTSEDLIKLSHYTNLQYLTESDNLKKSARLDWSNDECEKIT